jgi:predicted DNA-binding transcriptional regulator AlpA
MKQTQLPVRDERLMTTKDVAALLRTSVKAVYRMPIACIQLGARTRRYRMADVEAYLLERYRRSQ